MKSPKTQPIAAAVAIMTIATILVALALSSCDDSSKPNPSVSTSATASASAPVPTPPASSATAEPGLPEDDGQMPPDVAPSTSGEAPPAAKSAAPTAAPTAAPKAAPKSTPAPAQPPPPKPVTPPKPTAKTPAPAPPPPAEAAKLPAAAKDSADAVAERIDELFGPLKTFRARFNQKYWVKAHDKSKTNEGILYVLKPGKLSLSYHAPNKNRAVSDGTTLKVYEHENNQMFLKNVKNTEYPGAFAFILGKGLRQSFTFTFHKTSKWEGGPVIVGTPRVPNPGYNKVLFYIDDSLLEKGDLGAVRRVLVVDAQGNRNRFDFVHAEEPEEIGPNEFKFEPPKGTEIIKG